MKKAHSSLSVGSYLEFVGGDVEHEAFRSIRLHDDVRLCTGCESRCTEIWASPASKSITLGAITTTS